MRASDVQLEGGHEVAWFELLSSVVTAQTVWTSMWRGSKFFVVYSFHAKPNPTVKGWIGAVVGGHGRSQQPIDRPLLSGD